MTPYELRSEIETLLADWAHAIDSGHAETAACHYSDTAEQHLPGSSSVGIDQIRAGLAMRQRAQHRITRHLFSNLRLVAPDGSGARAQVEAHSVLTLFRTESDERSTLPFMVADVVDRFERGEDGRLRIAHRQVVPVFKAAA